VSILTRLSLDPTHRAVTADLADINSMHVRVMSLLPDNLGDSPRHTTQTLHRIDGASTGTPTLLVQTTSQINSDRLPRGYALHVDAIDLANLTGHLIAGTTVQYSLVGNPSKRIAHGPMRGKRIGLHSHDAILTWWQRFAHRSGLALDVPTTRIDPAGTLTGRRSDSRTPMTVRHHASRISGLATITNTADITTALNVGIGPGKSHGLGLLTVVPLKPDLALQSEAKW